MDLDMGFINHTEFTWIRGSPLILSNDHVDYNLDVEFEFKSGDEETRVTAPYRELLKFCRGNNSRVEP